MKKFILATLLSLPIYLSAGQYVGIHGGPDYGFKTDTSNSGQKVGYKIGAIYGYAFASQFRTEAEVSYRQAHKRTVYKDKNIDQLVSRTYESKHSWSYMVNVCYDVNQLAMYSVTPFVGAGVGFANSVNEYKIKYDNHADSEKRRDSDFAWQALAGVSYTIADATQAKVQYTYHRGQQHTINHAVNVALVRAF